MTITIMPSVNGCSVMVRDKVVLRGVPKNVVISPASSASAFLGATSTIPSSRHVFSLGVLEGYKFLSLFRFKIWWMQPLVGKSGREIPMETQMLLIEVREDSALHNVTSSDAATGNTFYFFFLPALDGNFRTSLQGSPANELQFCVESGDVAVQTSQILEGILVNAGDNPFELIQNSVKILEKHKGTFAHLDNKRIPDHLDWFGWCTWDAFYWDVNPQGIIEGLQSFCDGGCLPKFLIIDDGWQEVGHDFHEEGQPSLEETQFAYRLADIKENSKFRSSGSDCTYADLQELIHSIKEKY